MKDKDKIFILTLMIGFIIILLLGCLFIFLLTDRGNKLSPLSTTTRRTLPENSSTTNITSTNMTSTTTNDISTSTTNSVPTSTTTTNVNDKTTSTTNNKTTNKTTTRSTTKKTTTTTKKGNNNTTKKTTTTTSVIPPANDYTVVTGPTNYPNALDDWEWGIVNLINQARQNKGYPKLKVAKELRKLAEEAADLWSNSSKNAVEDYLEGYNFYGKAKQNLATSYQELYENTVSEVDVVNDRYYEYVGVGVIKKGSKYYYVIIFE